MDASVKRAAFWVNLWRATAFIAIVVMLWSAVAALLLLAEKRDLASSLSKVLSVGMSRARVQENLRSVNLHLSYVGTRTAGEVDVDHPSCMAGREYATIVPPILWQVEARLHFKDQKLASWHISIEPDIGLFG